MSAPPSVLRIERLDLTFRGVPAATAQAAAHGLAPALATALARPTSPPPGDTIHAPASIDAPALSDLLATHLAARIRAGGRPPRSTRQDASSTLRPLTSDLRPPAPSITDH